MDGDLGSSLNAFKEYFNKYDNFVRLNPRLANEVESIIRWSSYLVASKKSPILGELLSSGANLLQLCNDIILRQANPQLKLNLSSVVTQLKTFLAVIQSLELLAEIYARDTFGTAGKWAIITVIQIAKAAIKLILLIAYDQGITKSQYIVPLDRIYYSEIVKLQEKFASSINEDVADEETNPKEIEASKSIVLKSSGRKMRSITESPPKGARFVSDRINSTTTSAFDRLQKQRLTLLLERYREHRSATLTDRQLYGEILHIARPLAHLALIGAFGTKSWLSFFTSIAMDVSSLYLVRSPLPLTNAPEQSSPTRQQAIPECFQFNINEKMELGQRASSLLLYLLRSPFFDEYTKQKALEGLSSSAESIPFIGSFLATFVHYIPEWQSHYFRVWSE